MEYGENLLDNLRSNHLARTAPCREAVEDHEGLLVVDGSIEVGLATSRVASAAPTTYDVARVAQNVADTVERELTL